MVVINNNSSLFKSPSIGEGSIKYRNLKPFKTNDLKVLLLENVSQVAVQAFMDAGFTVEQCKSAISESELIEKLKTVHALGIRSKSNISESVLQKAPLLLTVGCFCIGTNQVDGHAALGSGISVFNSPFSNSRSVAEMVICEIIMLSRRIGDLNMEMHMSNWSKISHGCHEVRSKVLGIIGYGHIGSQLSVLAESLGMKVYFWDIEHVMPLGMAKSTSSLQELLQISDFVSLHVPATPETKMMISHNEISEMKPTSFLINASRGSVVDLGSLKNALDEKRLAGAAIDVYPEEPQRNGKWATGLEGYKNVILTPHIGGSTEEAQANIGAEVADHMIKFINTGRTIGSVNFPPIDQSPPENILADYHHCRLLNVHRNIPGVLRKINDILADFNIEKQVLESRGEFSYLMVDISTREEGDVDRIYNYIFNVPESVSTRIVY